MSYSNSNFGRLNKPRSKKLKVKIDLTAMVSISFLLIIFFMISEEISKPKSIALGLPDKDSNIPTCIFICGNYKSRVITLLLDDNNKIISYLGLLEISEEKPKKLSYGNDIRKELLLKSKQIQNNTSSFGRHNSGAIVIIKPSKKSNFKNLVDILDEMNITNIPTYAIINDYTPEEIKLLACN